MSGKTVEATQFSCDNPSCGVKRLSTDKGVPVGWFQVVFGSVLSYCSRACIDQHLRATGVERRDTGGGWIVSSLVPTRTRRTSR